MSEGKKGMELVFERKRGPEGDYLLAASVHSAHYKIINLVGRDKRVLDVGCGSGYLGAEFRKRGCFVAGIEQDPGRSANARKLLDEVYAQDVQDPDKMPFKEGSFDVIVFADILEHLCRPDEIVSQFRRFLKAGGFIVVSVPNICRIDMRLKMLFGRFEYDEGGIADKTHLRFFTKDSICRLLAGAGYRVETIQTTGLASRLKAFRFLDRLLAFQFILTAKPAGKE